VGLRRLRAGVDRLLYGNGLGAGRVTEADGSTPAGQMQWKELRAVNAVLRAE
jgi:hypothetical protein